MVVVNDCLELGKFYKEVIIFDGVWMVLLKILLQRKIYKYVIVVIFGNFGLIEFYDDFVMLLFDVF